MALMAGVAVSCTAVRNGQRAENEAQLRQACSGLLPADQLLDFLPDDEPGVLEEFGTLLDPSQESRSLLDCTLSWGSGKWEPDARVQVRAEALLPAQIQREADEESDEGDEEQGLVEPDESFPLPLPAGVTGRNGSESTIEGSEASATVRMACPKGLNGRAVPASALRVEAVVPSNAEDESDIPYADEELAARTAAKVANHVAKRQGCDAASLSTRTKPEGKEAAAPTDLCSWLNPEELEFAEGTVDDDPDSGMNVKTDNYGWLYTGDRAYDARAGSCAGEAYIGSGTGEHPIERAQSHSWSGPFARGAYERYRDAGLAPSGREPTPASPRGTVTIKNDEETEPKLALWAQSQCDGGKSYHRITITPDLEFWDDKELTLTRAERKKISADARATLDRYLTTEGAWPQRSHCSGTKILGEVEQWRG
ncbi:hypothetical protein [Streptomyces sp. NPDC002851]